MHILHLYKDYYPVLGGIENHVRLLAEAQAQEGHQVTVLVTNPHGPTTREKLNGVTVIKAGRLATVASTPLSWELPQILRTLAPDITHLQAPYPMGEVAQLGVGRLPYVVSYQAEVSKLSQRLVMQAYGPVFRRLLDGAAAILATSPNFVAHSPYLTPEHQAKVALVPIGCDAQRFTPPATPRAAANPIILFLGVLRHYKGGDDAIRALSLLRTGELWFGGAGPQQAAWAALAHDLGVAARVKFLGRVPDEQLPDLYRAADVFVLPSTSRAESYGTVLVEAMATGLPCVTTEIQSGNSFVVQQGRTGLVVPPRHPLALAEALQTLLRDPALRQRFGQAGRARVLEHFTREKMLARVAAVYRQVTAK